MSDNPGRGDVHSVVGTPQAASSGSFAQSAALDEVSRPSGSNGGDTSADVMDIDHNSHNQQEGDSDSDAARISKPAGEAGRRKSGGYNLQMALEDHGWTEKQFTRRRDFVVSLIDEHLDTSVTYMHQDKEAVKTVVREAIRKYPQFDKFKKAWPIIDIMKGRLRYTASRSPENHQHSVNSPQTVRTNTSARGLRLRQHR